MPGPGDLPRAPEREARAEDHHRRAVVGVRGEREPQRRLAELGVIAGGELAGDHRGRRRGACEPRTREHCVPRHREAEQLFVGRRVGEVDVDRLPGRIGRRVEERCRIGRAERQKHRGIGRDAPDGLHGGACDRVRLGKLRRLEHGDPGVHRALLQEHRQALCVRVVLLGDHADRRHASRHHVVQDHPRLKVVGRRGAPEQARIRGVDVPELDGGGRRSHHEHPSVAVRGEDGLGLR